MSRQIDIRREGRLALAINSIKKGHSRTIRGAARSYDVPEATHRHRLKGRTSRTDIRANNHKLTATEEEALKKWIVSLVARGASPRPAFVREMANVLLMNRGNHPISKIGQNWVTNFLRRNKDFKTKYFRRYDYKRAKCEDPKLILEWFERVQAMITEYGIHEDDIWNFDETGFAIGIIATA